MSCRLDNSEERKKSDKKWTRVLCQCASAQCARKLVRKGLDGAGKHAKTQFYRQNSKENRRRQRPPTRVRLVARAAREHVSVRLLHVEGPAFCEENTTSQKQFLKEGMELASKVTRKSMKITNRVDKPQNSGMDRVMAPSAESDARNTTAGNSQGSANLDVEELLAYGTRPHQRRLEEDGRPSFRTILKRLNLYIIYIPPKGACVHQESARCHASILELGHPKKHDRGRRSVS